MGEPTLGCRRVSLDMGCSLCEDLQCVSLDSLYPSCNRPTATSSTAHIQDTPAQTEKPLFEPVM